jgi:hypothetical protein
VFRAASLLLAGFGLASIAGGVATGAPRSVHAVSVRVGLTTAVVSVRSPAPAKAALELGTDRTYGLNVVDAANGREHDFRLAGLAPARHYEYRVTTGGTTARGSFTTGAASSPIEVSVTRTGGFAISEGSFFPIAGQLDNCIDPRGTIRSAVGMGIDILAGHSVLRPTGKPKTCTVSKSMPAWKPLDSLLGHRAWFLDYNAANKSEAADLKGLPEQAMWPGFIQTLYGADELVSCASTGNTLTYSIVHAKTLQAPLVYVIPLSDKFRHGSEKLCITSSRVQAEFWTAIAAGARGIDYATFGSPTSRNPDFAVEDAVRRQVARQDAHLATLGPAILTGAPISIPSASIQVRYGAWDYGGALYLVAVNTASTATSASLLLRPFAGKTADVLWENRRSLHLRKGILTDDYGPLAVRIYRIA